MADNYLLFSETIDLKNAAEMQWWQDATSDIFRNEGVHWKGFSDYPHDAPWFISHPEVEFGDDYIVFYSEDWADIEPLCWLVQKFLQWRKQTTSEGSRWVLSWAETCSKARPGEFSGGVAVVTEDGYSIKNALEFVDALEEEIRKAK